MATFEKKPFIFASYTLFNIGIAELIRIDKV